MDFGYKKKNRNQIEILKTCSNALKRCVKDSKYEMIICRLWADVILIHFNSTTKKMYKEPTASIQCLSIQSFFFFFLSLLLFVYVVFVFFSSFFSYPLVVFCYAVRIPRFYSAWLWFCNCLLDDVLPTINEMHVVAQCITAQCVLKKNWTV